MTIVAASDTLDLARLLLDAGLPAADADEVGPRDVRLAVEGDVTIGCVAVQTCGAWGLLRSLAVAPSVRGQGVGRGLVAAAEALARERGLDALVLLTTTAAPFFEALGYVPVARNAVPESVRQTREFASLCPASAHCLWKPAVQFGGDARRF